MFVLLWCFFKYEFFRCELNFPGRLFLDVILLEAKGCIDDLLEVSFLFNIFELLFTVLILLFIE